MTIEEIRALMIAQKIDSIGPGAIDDVGIERYKPSQARLLNDLNHVPDLLVSKIQDALMCDSDGSWGPGTTRALHAWQKENGERQTDSLMAVPMESVATSPFIVDSLLEDFPHIQQADPRWKEREIVPGKTLGAKGCLTCVCESIRAYVQQDTPDVVRFLEQMQARGGYQENGNLDWHVAAAVTGLGKYDRNVTHLKAMEMLDAGKPVVLELDSGHFVCGIGACETGFYTMDVGWRVGYFYDNIERNTVPFDRVRRCDIFV